MLIGVDEHGRKELVAIEDGYRESEQSWLELLLGLKARGLEHAAQLAIGDGALGFWKALEEVFPTTGHQRCWLHKIVKKMRRGEGTADDIELLGHVCDGMMGLTICPLSDAAVMPMRSFIDKFRPEFEALIQETAPAVPATLSKVEVPAFPAPPDLLAQPWPTTHTRY